MSYWPSLYEVVKVGLKKWANFTFLHLPFSPSPLSPIFPYPSLPHVSLLTPLKCIGLQGLRSGRARSTFAPSTTVTLFSCAWHPAVRKEQLLLSTVQFSFYFVFVFPFQKLSFIICDVMQYVILPK